MAFNDPMTNMQDPIMAGMAGQQQAQDPNMAALAMMQQPSTGMVPQQLSEPTMSEKLLNLGIGMINADQAGLGLGGSVAYGLKAYADTIEQNKRKLQQARADRLAEYDLLGRIRERHMTEEATLRKYHALDTFKKNHPELADLADIDPEAAVKAALAANTPTKPFEGSAMDAQVQNILLTGDPNSAAYKAAYNISAAPKMQVNPVDGSIVTITPDMSAYRPPAGIVAPVAPSSSVPPSLPAGTNPDMSSDGSPMSQSIGGATVTMTPATKTKPLSGELAKYALAAEQMDKAEQLINSPTVSGGVSGQTGGVGMTADIIGAIPSAGLGESIGAGLKKSQFTPAEKQYDNAAENWVTAKLRAESGATISPSEITKQKKIFFPTTNDDPATIAQKAAMRADSINAIKTMAASKAPTILAPSPIAPTTAEPFPGFSMLSAEEQKKARSLIEQQGGQ